MIAPLLLSVALAGALPADAVLLDPHGWAAGDDTYDLALEQAVAHPAWGTGAAFWMPGRDGVLRPLDAYRPVDLEPTPDKDVASAGAVVHVGRGDGALTGKAIYVSQCHGYMYFDTLGRFSTQRPNLFDTIEDFHNPEGANTWLIPYLENAGAAVFTARERDPNPLSSIADNDGQHYLELGATFTDGLAGFRELAAIPYGTDPFDAGTTRRMVADSGDRAVWTPPVPADGWYAVYVSWDAEPGNAPDAHYVLRHPGGEIHRVFDQRVHGSTWQYVETLWLPEGPGNLVVELVADSAARGATLSADAVRIGGGMAEVERFGAPPPTRRWEAAAISYTQYNGAPTSVYDYSGNGVGTDHVSRSKWADWEHPTGEDAVYLSWHSNAATGTARGTVTYFAGGGPDAPPEEPPECARPAIEGSYTLSRRLQDELVQAARALWEPSWPDRGIGTACFSEVSPAFNDEMPSALVELAFHDNATDAAYLKHPAFRRDMARAMTRAIVRYFAERDGYDPVFQPEPPERLELVHDDQGRVRLSWVPGPIGAPFGDAPDTYVVETSPDGRVWRSAFSVTGLSTDLGLVDGGARFVRVSAVNDGGISFPSEVIGARQSPDGAAPVLVVSGFDRLDRGLLPLRAAAYVGDVVTMELARLNPFDTAVAHGEALRDLGWTFDTVSDEGFTGLDLSPYALVWWVAGEESSGTTTLDAAQQQVLRDFVAGGGKLWISGAEVLWDLDAQGDAADRAFARDVLGATMASDDAGTTQAYGVGPLAAVGALDFGEADGAPYPVEYPDVLASDRTPLVRYGDGSVAAVYGDGVVTMGFPFECIGDPDARRALAGTVLDLLLPGLRPTSVPTPVDTGAWTPWTAPTGDTDEPADTDVEPTPTPAVGDTDDPRDTEVIDTDVPGGRGDPAGEDDEGARKGCGCDGSASRGGALLAMMAGLVVSLRRAPRRRRGEHGQLV